MSRTYKDRNKQWRIIRNSKIKKILKCYSDDIVGKIANILIDKEVE